MYYFDCANDKAKICYVDSGYLGFSANQGFFTHFKKSLGKLDVNKMFQMFMDRPSVL